MKYTLLVLTSLLTFVVFGQEKCGTEEYTHLIEEKYPVFRQQFFQALFTEAVALGLTNRVTYIKGLLDWCKSVVEYTNTLDDQLETMTSAQEIGALFPDFSSFEESDPEVTIKGALAIED